MERISAETRRGSTWMIDVTFSLSDRSRSVSRSSPMQGGQQLHGKSKHLLFNAIKLIQHSSATADKIQHSSRQIFLLKWIKSIHNLAFIIYNFLKGAQQRR